MTHINLAEEIEKSKRPLKELIKTLREQGIDNEQVINALERSPRQCFLEEALWHRAYENLSLPIIAKQTISQPYMVARMTQLLIENSPSLEKVLEIGTGSGYQAYVLSHIFSYVFTIERIEPLHIKAKETFKKLGNRNIYSKFDDGKMGWPEEAPYPAIMVTAALKEVPRELKEQLAPDGVLVAPLGNEDEVQTLILIRKTDDGFEQQELEPVRFVPALSGTAS